MESEPPVVLSKREKKRIAAENRRIALKKDELFREIQLGLINTKRYRKTWLDNMMRIKMPTIRENIQMAWKTFNRALDIKDYSISLYLDSLEKAEKQYQLGQSTHAEQIDHLLGIYRSTLQAESSRYQESIQEVFATSDLDCATINYEQCQSEIFLQALIFAMDQRIAESLSNLTIGAITKVDTLAQDNHNLRKIAASILERKLGGLWEELNRILEDYHTSTEERRKAYSFVKAKDEKERKIIASQMQRIESFFEIIQKHKDKISHAKEIANEELSVIKFEHDFFHNAYKSVKNRLTEEMEFDKQQLTRFTVEYNKSMSRLKDLENKGAHILTLMTVCSKYETQDEKIVRFALSGTTNEETSYKEYIDLKIDTSMFEKVHLMDNFWKHCGEVEMITAEMRLERNALRKEFAALKKCLKSYLQ